MKLLVEIFKLLSTKCTYWVTADAVYLNFVLPTWQMKLRVNFGAKEQYKIMVPPSQAWTGWWRRWGLTSLAGRGGLSEVESWRCSRQLVRYDDLGFSTQEKKKFSHFYCGGKNPDRKWLEFLQGFFLIKKKNKNSSKYFKSNKIYTNARIIFFINQSDCKHYWQILMWFSYKSSFPFHDWLH